MVVYEAETPPDTGNSALEKFIEQEFQRVTEGFFGIEEIQLPELNVAVAKPRDGMIIFADGVNWEPDGAGGQGYYGYYNAAWHKLG